MKENVKEDLVKKPEYANVNQYGVKTLQSTGQKYILCHFTECRRGLSLLKVFDFIQKNNDLCISCILQDNDKYLFEPFSDRAIGFVIDDYKKIIGWSKQNESTNVRRNGYKKLQKDIELNFVKSLNKAVSDFKDNQSKRFVDKKDFLKFIENSPEKSFNSMMNSLYKSGDVTIGEGKNKIIITSDEKQAYLLMLESMKNTFKIPYQKALNKNEWCKFYDEYYEKEYNNIQNNQMNVSSANISSIIINMCNNKEKQNARLTEIVKEINNIIDIQLNKLGHKNILIRNAKTKKISTISLYKFVDLIEKECKKIGIKPLEINKKFPTSLSVLHKIEDYRIKKNNKEYEKELLYKKEKVKILNKEIKEKTKKNTNTLRI